MEEPKLCTLLPYEVIGMILNHIPLTKLLTDCRLVCKLWNEVSKTICRRSGVSLNTSKIHSETNTNCGSIFPNITNLPWSCLSFSICSSDTNKSNEILHVIETFGESIQFLSGSLYDCDSAILIKYLEQMPNLREIELNVSTPEFDTPPQPDIGNIGDISRISNSQHSLLRLPKLNKFKLYDYTDGSFTSIILVEILLRKCKSPLRTLKCSLTGATPCEFQQIMEAITSTPSIQYLSLKLPYSRDTSLTWMYLCSSPKKQKNIFRSLHIYFKDLDYGDSCFDLLRRSLRKFKKLQKLKLNGIDAFPPGSAAISQLLQIPELPNLQLFQFEHPCEIPYFQPIPTWKFPNLNTVVIRGAAQMDSAVVITDISLHQIFDTNNWENSFETVKVLDVDSYNGGGPEEWTQYFPNVLNLRVTIEEPTLLSQVFHYLTDVEELHICIDSQLEINSLICAAFHAPPELSHLRKLTIEGDEDRALQGNVIRDSGAILFNLFQPLDLTIENAWITEHCLHQLKSRHSQFKLVPYNNNIEV